AAWAPPGRASLPPPGQGPAPQLHRRSLRLAAPLDHLRALVAHPRQRGGRTRALLAGRAQPPEDLVPIVRLARAVLLDHHERDLVDALVGGEAAAARQALPSTTDHQAVLPLARVHHLVLDM